MSAPASFLMAKAFLLPVQKVYYFHPSWEIRDFLSRTPSKVIIFHCFSFISICYLSIYATPKVTKYQRCNYIIQIHKFTIKIDTISINLLFECVKIVEFNFNSHVFLVMYQEIRFCKSRCLFS